MRRLSLHPVLLATLLCGPAALRAQQGGVEIRSVRLDDTGVICWADTGGEVALFGANYTLPSSGDYRAAGRLTQDRKRLVDEDMAHFARMGWNGLRVAFWGDWQNADRAGNLIENDHLDLVDYIVAKAKERGIYILFNPIHTYHAGWPDAMSDSFPGFAAHIQKNRLGTDSAAIAAQVNYIRQILEHVNPYTGVALKDEPAILFVEMINEPIHHPEDLEGSVRYIDALVDAVRGTGSRAITFHNVSQDFRIAEAIRRSQVQGASFGWYPTGLNSGAELRGNHLRSVEDYPAMRMAELAGLPRVVYEFDSADQLTGTMYPAMAREYRRGGVQLAAMFAYDMLRTASRNLGWQTHYLNLVYTPRKAMSAIIAAEVMRRLPAGEDHGPYPRNNTFGDFRLRPEADLAELAAPDAFLHTGDTDTRPPDPARLQRVAGHGSSPVVAYEGEGLYFLDRVRDGVWRLEVYPDAVPVEDPFEQPGRRDRIVTRAIFRAWPMHIDLPDLGAAFHAQAIVQGNAGGRAENGRITVRPGVYVLSREGPVQRASLPSRIGAVRFDEFVVPAPDPLGVRVVLDPPAQHTAGRPLVLDARVVAEARPDDVRLWIRSAGPGGYRPVPMERTGAYGYRATVPADRIGTGIHAYVLSVTHADSTTTFPGRVRGSPADWDFGSDTAWRIAVVGPSTPATLFDASRDIEALSFSRIGDGWREGIFRVVPSGLSGEAALHLELPVNVGGISPEDYTTSLFVGDRVAARDEHLAGATGLGLSMRGIGPHQELHVTLVERDGTSWGATVTADATWSHRTVPLSDLRITRGVKLPQGFPGTWNYWMEPAAGRGGAGDSIRLHEVERLQLSLRRTPGTVVAPGAYGVEVESITLRFEGARR